MKCLSLRQPWLWMVLHGKHIENRKWPTGYRGPILLHASKGCTASYYDDAIDWVQDALGLATAAQVPPLAELQRGGIVGRARIVDVARPGDGAKSSLLSYWGVDMRWHMREQFGFVLADVEPLPFVPYKGALGLFEVPDGVVP